MFKTILRKLGEKIDLFNESYSKNEFGEKVKIYNLHSSDINSIIKLVENKESVYSNWKDNLSYKVRIPFDIEVHKGDLIKDKNWNSFLVKFTEEKIALQKENSFKQAYCEKVF